MLALPLRRRFFFFRPPVAAGSPYIAQWRPLDIKAAASCSCGGTTPRAGSSSWFRAIAAATAAGASDQSSPPRFSPLHT